MRIRDLRVPVEGGPVSGLLLSPPDARALLVFGHGAGVGMRHHFMEECARRLADRGVATLRYHFPYAERGSRRPDPQPLLLATVRAVAAEAGRVAPELPRFLGGKSMGGRMSSLAISQQPMPEVRGLVFFGFPLHRPGAPDASRAEHLDRVVPPMLFLQGDRDQLAALDLLRPVATGARRTLHVIQGADHGFHMLKRSGRDDPSVLDELADVCSDWMLRQIEPNRTTASFIP